jgi:hypothetical protein
MKPGITLLAKTSNNLTDSQGEERISSNNSVEKGQLGNPNKGEHPPLEAVTRRLVKIMTETTSLDVIVIYVIRHNLCFKISLNLIINPILK